MSRRKEGRKEEAIKKEDHGKERKETDYIQVLSRPQDDFRLSRELGHTQLHKAPRRSLNRGTVNKVRLMMSPQSILLSPDDVEEKKKKNTTRREEFILRYEVHALRWSTSHPPSITVTSKKVRADD